MAFETVAAVVAAAVGSFGSYVVPAASSAVEAAVAVGGTLDVAEGTFVLAFALGTVVPAPAGATGMHRWEVVVVVGS